MQKIFKIAILSLLLASVPTFALQSDNKQPTQIEADQGLLDQARQVTHFSGNVIIKQGTLNLRVTNVRAPRNDKGERFMAAGGSPVKFSQTLDDNQDIVNGRTNNAEYSLVTSIAELTGNAKVQHDSDIAQGAVVTYNIRTEVYNIIGGGKSSAEAGAKSGRVSVVTQPSGAQKK